MRAKRSNVPHCGAWPCARYSLRATARGEAPVQRCCSSLVRRAPRRGSSPPLGRGGLELERVESSANVVLDSASVSGLGVGVSAEARAWLGPFGLRLYGVWLPPNAAVIGRGQRAAFSLLAGGGRACHGLLGRAGLRSMSCRGWTRSTR